jgi:hypothetical protein
MARRDTQTHIRLRHDELTMMRAVAERAGKSVSRLVRELFAREQERQRHKAGEALIAEH